MLRKAIEYFHMNKLIAVTLGMILLGCGSDDGGAPKEYTTPHFTKDHKQVTVKEGQKLRYQIIVTNVDLDLPSEGVAAWSLDAPEWIYLTAYTTEQDSSDRYSRTAYLNGTPSRDDVGEYSVTVTFTDRSNSTNSNTIHQTFTLTVEAVNNEPTGSVEITGDLKVGSTLTATNTLADIDGLGTITYQWLADNVAITGATSDTLELTQAQVGSVITVTASYTDDFGFENAKTSAASTPVVGNASSGSQIQAIDTNAAITALLTKEGTVQVWGRNAYGTLGHLPGTNDDTDTGSTYYNPAATTISGLTSVASIAVGYHFVLALKDDGTVWAWGRNEFGELGHVPGQSGDVTTENYYTDPLYFIDLSDGDGFEYFNTTPVQVTGLTGITAIAASAANGYALKSDGTVWAWGDNSFSQLGIDDNSVTQSGTPVQVKNAAGSGNLENIVAIFASDLGSAFATENDGTVWAWGLNNTGQLGLNDNTNKTRPIEHPSLTDVTYIEVSGQLGAALLLDGTVSYWGDSAATSITTITSSPTDSGLTNVAELSVESHGLIVLKDDGTAQAVGANLLGELGNGSTGNIATPTTIMASERFVHVAKGEFFTAAILEDGSLKAWGNNASGQLGHTPNTNGDVQPGGDGADIYNLAGVTVDGIAANTLIAPSNLEATVGANLVLSWGNVTGADSYNIYWSTTPDVNPSNGTKIENATNGAALSLTSGKRYYLIVTAVDASGKESVGSLELAVDFPSA